VLPRSVLRLPNNKPISGARSGTFDLCIRDCDLSPAWRDAHDGWRSGRSYVKPFRNAALEDFALATDDRLLIVVRERLAGLRRRSYPQSGEGIEVLSADTFDEECEILAEWPLDFASVQIPLDPGQKTVEFRAGLWGSAPLYLFAGDGELRGHWDPARLYPCLSNSRLVPELAARYLAHFSLPYSRKTLFPGIHRLTERARGCWERLDGNRWELTIDYPDAAVHPLCARTVKGDADVIAGFIDIVTASTRRWLHLPAAFLSAQLSGGLDSSIVAGTASRLSGGSLRTYGLVMPGPPGVRQQKRRYELCEVFGFEDQRLDILDYPPFVPKGSRMVTQRVVPWEEIYFEAFETLLALARQSGAAVSLNGTGGDELCSRHWHEMTAEQQACRRQEVLADAVDFPAYLTSSACEAVRDTLSTIDRAPVSPLFTSALEAACAVSSLFLRTGIWPLSPLCTPELVRFCRSLPLPWRQNRRIQREVLLRMGCSRAVAYPTATEDFAPVLDLTLPEAARPLFERLFRESRLAELGLVDADRLLSAYREYCQRQDNARTVPFYAAGILELTLRSVEALGSVHDNLG
jgi:asparagine synthase (glutamine-hydrolysing)